MKRTVYYHDTDCGGVVYYGRYLEFLEEARTAWFVEHGCAVRDLIQQGVYFVVSEVKLDYRYPARYGDTLEVVAQVKACTRTSIEFMHEALSLEGKKIIEGTVRLVCVDKDFKPRALPPALKKRIESDGQ